MAKSKQDELIKFDARMIEYNLARGIITKEEYEKYLSQLADSGSNATALTMEDDRSEDSH